MDGTPIVVEYDPNWPREFEALASVLEAALGELAAHIHHVGSTSIPGMSAKPILDIDVELVPGASCAEVSALLSPLGYEYEGDLGIPERYAYARVASDVPRSTERTTWPEHHLYVCPAGSLELARHLHFRDALRADQALCREYVNIKREALRLAAGVRRVYVEEKARLGERFFRKVLEGPS